MMTAEEDDPQGGDEQSTAPGEAGAGRGRAGSVEGVSATENYVTSCPEEPVTDGNKVTAHVEGAGGIPLPSGCQVVVPDNQRSAKERFQRACLWSITKYKSTRQVLKERMGRASRTVDQELQNHILVLHDDRQRYDHVTRLAQTLADQLSQLTVTQSMLGDAFAELSVRSPELHVEFSVNADTQRFLSKGGDGLVGSVTSFSTEMTTLVNKTIEDTLVNVKQYEAARVEYDAYRCDVEQEALAAQTPRGQARLEQARKALQNHQDQYHQARDDLQIKLQLLQENKVKVLHNQLVLLYSAVASCNSSSLLHLQQGSARLSLPSQVAPSWLEHS
ncbi:arfaptin-1-like [Osmerus eperlanus]|uniref:arfaptin-1-like n=1 Tax=Osmerus eperlanus TaxID=29151 RepID=UPI002E115FFB